MIKFIRIFLGIFLAIMGLNKFFNFLPQMELAAPAEQFMTALAQTGYMLPMVGIVEILCGVLLFASGTTPLALLLLAPHSVNIVLFHLFLDPSTILMAAIVAALNLFLAVYYFNYYRSIFANLLEEKVEIKNKSRRKPNGRVATIN